MIKRFFVVLLLLFMSVFVFAQENLKITINKDVQLIQLEDSIFIHKTWSELEDFGRFFSNGLIIVKNGEALMIDTPMDNEKTEVLINYLKDSMSIKVTKLIIGHFHDDCLGGLDYLQKMGVESIANAMTIEKCKELGLPIPSTPFTDSLLVDFNGELLECRYFGAGHTADNIIVWLPSRQILFGGCLIRSMQAKNLGNITDAKISDWDTTVSKVIKKYPNIKTVVPGHGKFSGADLLYHTAELVKEAKHNGN